jgi:predicted transcriptional regulator
MTDVENLASRVTIADVAVLALLYASGGEATEGDLLRYSCKLGFCRLELQFLKKLGLVAKSQEEDTWRITRRGVEMLELVSEVLRLYSETKKVKK